MPSFRLTTVRAKLTLLVALSCVVMLATLPVLSWLLHKQLIDEVDDRVFEAQTSFKAELEDDLSDLTLAARVISSDSDTERALTTSDEKAAHDLAQLFLSIYPNIDILLVDAAGKVLVQLGCAVPPDPAMTKLRTADFRGVIERGCEKPETGSAPAYLIAVPVKHAGMVAVALPLDIELISNAALKLGLELAILQPSGAPIASTKHFPLHSIPSSRSDETALADEGDTSFALTRFQVVTLPGPSGTLDAVTALDVGDIKKLVQRNLIFAISVLAFAAIVSVAFGARLASIMSRALSRVNVALRQLEKQQYVHVDALKTGDELEDLANGFNTMVDGLVAYDKMKTNMGKYMTAGVMADLMSGKVALGGETLTVTILFTDIRSFTTISEKMDAQALVGLLNEYFTDMVGIVMNSDGVVDKYIGDAIMAVFGAPVPKPTDALNAVHAAVKMRHALRVLNERLAERGIAPLRTGIGIHTGEVVAGNIGSERRMEYTVIGDAVNLASRLESNTKELGVNILISEDTYELTKGKVVARPIREITVKGRKKPVMTYEVIGFEGEVTLDEPPRPATGDRPSVSS